MKHIFLAVALILYAGFAQAAEQSSVKVFEYGTFASDKVGDVGQSREGIPLSPSANIVHLDATRTIVAQFGTQFGFRYRLEGDAPGTLVPLLFVARFPAPGIIGSDPKKALREDAYGDYGTVGKDNFLAWTFDKHSDLVPGVWTFEIWRGKTKLATQSFTVILPPIS